MLQKKKKKKNFLNFFDIYFKKKIFNFFLYLLK